MKFDKTQKRALVFVAGLLGLSWYMGNQFEKTDMMRSEGKRPCCSKPSMYFTMRGLSCRNCSKEDRIYRPAKEDSFNQMRSEADGYAYAYNEGHSDSRKDDDYQPVITSGREEARFRKILKQRAETFNETFASPDDYCSACHVDGDNSTGRMYLVCDDCGGSYGVETFNAQTTKKPKLTPTQLKTLNMMKASTFYGGDRGNATRYAYVEIDNRGWKPYTTRPVQALIDKGIVTIGGGSRKFYGRVESMEAYHVYLNPVAWEYPFQYDSDKSLSQVGDKIVQNKKIQQQEHARILKQKQDEENMTFDEVYDELFGAETFDAEALARDWKWKGVGWTPEEEATLSREEKEAVAEQLYNDWRAGKIEATDVDEYYERLENNAESEEIKITDIDWETDGEDVELPSSVMVPSDLEEDEIADYLSDNYGWLVNGFIMGAETFEADPEYEGLNYHGDLPFKEMDKIYKDARKERKYNMNHPKDGSKVPLSRRKDWELIESDLLDDGGTHLIIDALYEDKRGRNEFYVLNFYFDLTHYTSPYAINPNDKKSYRWVYNNFNFDPVNPRGYASLIISDGKEEGRIISSHTFKEMNAETMTPSEVEVKVTKDVTPKGSKVVVEECVDIQAHKADATANFYRVRFRDPTEMSNFRVPAWAARAANTMGSKYYDVAGSKVTMGQDKSGNWKIQSVMVPKRANVDVDLALKIANHIQDRLEKEGRWASKNCQDNERVLIIR